MRELRQSGAGDGLHSSVSAIPSVREMCFWRCGILGKRKGSHLVGIEGNPDHPMNQGRLCARGLAGTRLLYDPDRLKHPLVRVGQRGEGRWRQASWPEALDRVAEGLDKTLQDYSASGIAYFPHGASARYFKVLMNHLGINIYSSASFGQCRGPRDTGYKLTFGTSPGAPERTDYEHADAILLTGSHIGENVHTSHVRGFIRAISRGAELIVVDPRYSVAASKAHLWLPIRPGTDIAFLLAVMRYLIEHGLYDCEFVDNHCVGFDALKQAVAHATPQWAAAITDLPPDKIVEAASILGRARPRTVIHPGRFSAWYGNDTQRSRALAILTALLGAWGRKGGVFLPSPVDIGKLCCDLDNHQDFEEDFGPPRRHPFIDEGYPYQGVLRASLEDTDNPIKLWFIYGTNLLHSMPSPQRTVEALKKLDYVFMVDVLPTEPALYADVILPEAIYLERYDVPITVRHAKRPFVALRQPVTEALHDVRDPYWIAKQLAQRLRVQDCLQCDSLEQAIDRQFEKAGTRLAKVSRSGLIVGTGKPYFSPDRPIRFRTPSGKVELYSHRLAAAGLDPLPRYKPIPPPPEGFLRLVNGRSPYHTFTRTMNNQWLTEMDPVNSVWVNDQIAASVNLSNGVEVMLENQDGVRVGPVPVKVTPGIRPDIVFLPHGWGQNAPALSRAHHKGASDNRLMTAFAEDPETGATGLRVNFVRLVHNGRILNFPGLETFGIAPEPEMVAEPVPFATVIPEEEIHEEEWEEDWGEIPEEGC